MRRSARHSYHSGYAGHLRFLRARDCYSEPEAVYRVAKARGMDVVTITDHDSIDGCLEFLDRHPDADDFFISEEIECLVPGPGARRSAVRSTSAPTASTSGFTARSSRCGANVYEATAYLREQGVFYTLNHLFFFLRRRCRSTPISRARSPLFPAFEVRNGTMLEAHNDADRGDRRRAGARGLGPRSRVGGSDAHTLARRRHDLHRSARRGTATSSCGTCAPD